MIPIISSIIHSVGLIIELIGVLMVVISVSIAVYAMLFSKKNRDSIRIRFARNIIFGLEFIISADVLLVTVAQNLDEVMQLGGIVLIRILLGYALRQEFITDKNKLDKIYAKK